MLLQRIADDVWAADSELRMPALMLPLRMTVIRIDGDLFVHSPVALSDELAREIEAIGRVRWIVGPNCLHHLRLRPWRERWPTAELWAAPGLDAKRSDLTFTGVLAGATPPQWQGQLEAVLLEGVPKFGEVVFFHVPSGTLVCTDLVFNIQNPRGWAVWPMLKMMGTYKRFAMSRFWKMFVKDRVRLAASVERVLAWDIQRVVMAHGDIIDTDAHQRLADALAWMMRGGTGELPVSSRAAS